jgi:3-oxoacyl-[acyl-carrier protein] reductase
MNLQGKAVIVTGAARGLGRAISEELAGAGASIALLDVQAADCADAMASCAGRGVQARSYGCNVASEEQVATTFDRIVADFGRLDGIVNNAGILRDALLVKAKEGVISGKMSLAQWQAVIDVNLTGVFLCGREAAERMIRIGNGGVIVNISSISRAGNAGQSNYSAAKAGVAALAVVWARELARYDIRTGAIAPGFVATPMVATMKAEMLEMMLEPVPLQRLGQPEEIAHAARFIFENDFFTGRVLEVDGGLRL